MTTEWLTAALTGCGALGGAKVSAFDSETIGVGTGFLGKLARLSLRYDAEAPERPAP